MPQGLRMCEELVQSVTAKLEEAQSLYHRLVLLVGPSGSRKTQYLREVANRKNIPLVNVGIDLARLLLPLTDRQRALQTPQLMRALVTAINSEAVILDNLEVLFSPTLQQDPLRLLESLSRNRSIAAAWAGTTDGQWITYAEPDHPEYRRYMIKDLLIVDAQQRD